MKIAEQKKKLKALGVSELKETLAMYQKSLFSLRLNAATAHIKDYSQFKKLRANIARVSFFLQEKLSKK